MEELNDLKLDRAKKGMDAPFIYKYMSTKVALLSLLGNKCLPYLRFQQPSVWKDPAEKAFYKAKWLNKEKELRNPVVYACCVTTQQQNEASWISYLDNESDGSIKLSLSFRSFTGIIEEWADKNKCKFYIGRVSYGKWDEISSFDNTRNKFHKDVFKEASDTTKTFLRSLLLKREAFSYEKELRLFLVKQVEEISDKAEKTDIPQFIDVPIDWHACLHRIYIGEDCRYKDIRQLKETYDAIDESDLYKSKKPLVIKIS